MEKILASDLNPSSQHWLNLNKCTPVLSFSTARYTPVGLPSFHKMQYLLLWILRFSAKHPNDLVELLLYITSSCPSCIKHEKKYHQVSKSLHFKKCIESSQWYWSLILAIIGSPSCPSTSCLFLIVAPLSTLASARRPLLPSVGGTCTSLSRLLHSHA